MAGSRIKGITVEIGGDTTKLQAALKGVNSEIKNTQSQFKDVEKLLKLDPGNTELLAQKQKLLSSAVSETKEKLATLKTAAAQANQALANGDISKEQYDALQREIIETEEDLKKLETQANQSATAVQKIATAGESLKSAGDKVSSAVEKLLPASAAVTALGVAAVKTASDFDSSMSQVAAVSGATGEDFDKLRAKAREMGAKTKFSASEAADAMNYMAMAGWKTSDMLDGIEGICDDDLKLAFITMINKLVYCHKLVLKPYLKTLQENTGDASLLNIQQLEMLLEQNTEQRETLHKLMGQGYIDQILFTQENNALLSQANDYRNEIKALNRSNHWMPQRYTRRSACYTSANVEKCRWNTVKNYIYTFEFFVRFFKCFNLSFPCFQINTGNKMLFFCRHASQLHSMLSIPLPQIVTSNPRLQPDTHFAVDMFPYKKTELLQKSGFSIVCF